MSDAPLPSIDDLVATREAWHALAEHVLAKARYVATGRIGLRATAGGFGTPPYPSQEGERQLLVVGDQLVVRDDHGERSAPITTLAAAGEHVGVEPGAPTDVYTPTTPFTPDAPLAVDPATAARLADWFALVDQALAALRAEHPDEDPAEAQLWPEHFDLATTLHPSPDHGVNYGGSPGDEGHPAPYLYVGPWNVPTGGFWNEPFGASRSLDEVGSVQDALAFFREGHEQAARAR
jgi:hypothetical protein